jgi:hypothetical protein
MEKGQSQLAGKDRAMSEFSEGVLPGQTVVLAYGAEY